VIIGNLPVTINVLLVIMVLSYKITYVEKLVLKVLMETPKHILVNPVLILVNIVLVQLKPIVLYVMKITLLIQISEFIQKDLRSNVLYLVQLNTTMIMEFVKNVHQLVLNVQVQLVVLLVNQDITYLKTNVFKLVHPVNTEVKIEYVMNVLIHVLIVTNHLINVLLVLKVS